MTKSICLLLVAALPPVQAQETARAIDHSGECTYFGERHQEFAATGLQASVLSRSKGLTPVTNEVTAKLPALGAKIHVTDAAAASQSNNTVDKYLFKAMADAGVTPADRTNDYEFARRVSLDLTGRVPTVDRLLAFVADTDPAKRAKYIDELMNRAEWVDKWTMYFGDLFKNSSTNTQITRYPQGRDAFQKWIHDSLANGKAYDQMARELITARGGNTWTQGELNWVVGGRMTGGPIQDTWDQQASNVAETFLGLGNANCLECHNGRGHLDSLNLWGKNTTRMDMWGLSAFFSQASLRQVKATDDPKDRTYYWSWDADSRYNGYPLNTTNGNRPNRLAVGTVRTVMPVYPFTGATPAKGDNWQAQLANYVTSDFQFARATVNYIWKEFFGRGIVEPANQFDLARLDPDNPPPDPWTLQPTNPRLLNALAQDFINSNFDLKALMRELTASDAYQLSSRYDPAQWQPSMETLFARKLVRRLWAEEIHDNIVQTSNVVPNYTIADYGKTSWAMQFPETRGLPGGTVSGFLDSFQRGNRDDQTRNNESSVVQVLNLMNDSFVMSRTKATGKGDTASLLMQHVNKTDDQLIEMLYLTVLSRYPTNDERAEAKNRLTAGNRTQAAEDLLWSLYNKVDFVFNY